MRTLWELQCIMRIDGDSIDSYRICSRLQNGKDNHAYGCHLLSVIYLFFYIFATSINTRPISIYPPSYPPNFFTSYQPWSGDRYYYYQKECGPSSWICTESFETYFNMEKSSLLVRNALRYRYIYIHRMHTILLLLWVASLPLPLFLTWSILMDNRCDKNWTE